MRTFRRIVHRKRNKEEKGINYIIKQEKKVDEKEGWQPDVLKIERHAKVGRIAVKVKKQLVDKKECESSSNNKLN